MTAQHGLTWLLAVVAAAAVADLIRVRARLRHSRADVAALTTELRTSDGRARLALRERDALVRAAVGIAPHLPARGLRDSLDRALQTAAVELIEADGQPFDARVHRVVQRLPTDDEARHGTVATTVHRGYRDGTHLLRPADVAVHEHVPLPTTQEDRP